MTYQKSIGGKIFLRQKRIGVHRASHGHGARREETDNFEFCQVSVALTVLQAGPCGSVPESSGEGTALRVARLRSMVWGLVGTLAQHFLSKILMHGGLWWFL